MLLFTFLNDASEISSYINADSFSLFPPMSPTFQKFMFPLILVSLFSFYIIYLSFSSFYSLFPLLSIIIIIKFLLNPQMINSLKILFNRDNIFIL
jgi:hypothetical protein